MALNPLPGAEAMERRLEHHCRQCGNIFCAECSSKNALTPSSKKPVRVCDTCFNDLQG